MSIKSVGLIIFLHVACSFSEGDDTVSRVKWIVKLIPIELSWYEAYLFCHQNGMQLVSINTLKKQEHLNRIVNDTYNNLWIFKPSDLVQENIFKSIENIPNISKWNPSNQCILWYWLNVELCSTLRPSTNEWNYDTCDKNKYFACERVTETEEIVSMCQEMHKGTSSELAKEKLIQIIANEIGELINRSAVIAFVDKYSKEEREDEVKYVMQLWFENQHPPSVIREEAIALAGEVCKMKRQLDYDELHEFVGTYAGFKREKELRLIQEGFHAVVVNEYVKLKGDTKPLTAELLSNEMVDLIVEQIMKLAKKEQTRVQALQQAKLLETKAVVLEIDQIHEMAQLLVKLNEKELQNYKLELTKQLKRRGVEEFNTDLFIHWYKVMEQELFTLMSNTARAATSNDLRDFSRLGLSKIFTNATILQKQEKSVFGKMFLSIAREYALSIAENTISNGSDEHLRLIIKNEFEEMKTKVQEELKYEAFMRFIIGQFIAVAKDHKLFGISMGSDQLLMEDIVEAVASDMFWFVDNEIKVVAKQLAELREKESNEIIATFNKGQVYMTQHKLLMLMRLIEHQIFTITAKALNEFEAADEWIRFVKGELSSLLNGETFESIKENTEEWKGFMEKELSIWRYEDFAEIDDDELQELVETEYEMLTYIEIIDIYSEAYMRMITDEFIKLYEQPMATAMDEQGDRFGVTFTLLLKKLLEMATA